jgi:hypothetical protein
MKAKPKSTAPGDACKKSRANASRGVKPVVQDVGWWKEERYGLVVRFHPPSLMGSTPRLSGLFHRRRRF